MVKGLFVVFVVQIRLTTRVVIFMKSDLPKVRVRLDQDEKISLVDVDEHFAEGELLDADLYRSLRVLSLCELVQGSVLLLYLIYEYSNLKTYPVHRRSYSRFLHNRPCS